MKQIMKVTNGDLSNGVCDEYGCIYSKNGKRLLKAAKGLKSYSIKKGTEVIYDHAFSGILLKEVVLPKSLKKIGDFVDSKPKCNYSCKDK